MALPSLKIFQKNDTAVEQKQPQSKEAALFHRFLHGDDAAAIKIFQMYNSRLFVYCSKILGDAEQAEDVVQAVWERVIKMRANPQEVSNPTGFLFRIARNLSINHIKVRSRTIPLENLDELSHPVSENSGTSDVEELILSSLDALKFEDRELLVLHTYCGYKLEEIGEMLGISANAIWTRASRARARLRAIVMEHMSNEQ